MTYFDTTRVKQDLQLADTAYDSQISGVWGPDADDRIDNMIGAYITVPLTTIPDIIRTAANLFVQYRYYRSIHNDKAWQEAREEFDRIMADYILRLKQSTNLIVKSQGYRTFPLNPNGTPHRSISGGNNSTDDSDL